MVCTAVGCCSGCSMLGAAGPEVLWQGALPGVRSCTPPPGGWSSTCRRCDASYVFVCTLSRGVMSPRCTGQPGACVCRPLKGSPPGLRATACTVTNFNLRNAALAESGAGSGSYSVQSPLVPPGRCQEVSGAVCARQPCAVPTPCATTAQFSAVGKSHRLLAVFSWQHTGQALPSWTTPHGAAKGSKMCMYEGFELYLVAESIDQQDRNLK